VVGFTQGHGQNRTFFCANDFKLDRTHMIGKPLDFNRLKSLEKEGVLALIVESTASRRSATPRQNRLQMTKFAMLCLERKKMTKGFLL